MVLCSLCTSVHRQYQTARCCFCTMDCNPCRRSSDQFHRPLWEVKGNQRKSIRQALGFSNVLVQVLGLFAVLVEAIAWCLTVQGVSCMVCLAWCVSACATPRWLSLSRAWCVSASATSQVPHRSLRVFSSASHGRACHGRALPDPLRTGARS